MIKASDNGAEKQNTIAVAVTRMGSDPVPLTLHEGATVGEALEAAGITASGAELFVKGEEADESDVLEAGDTVSVVTPKQAGTR